MYKCEVEGCSGTTDTFLCARHQEMADSEDYYITTCLKCGNILKITKKKIPGMAKYKFLKCCRKCKETGETKIEEGPETE